jgi:hypothetical protein
MSQRPLRVLHVITRMIVGGAQENTMLSCALADPARFESELLTGPQTGPEGELHGESRARGVRLEFEPNLVREVAPQKDLLAIWRLWRRMQRGRYDVVHTHSSKAGIVGRIAARLAGVPVVVHTIHGWGFNGEQPTHVSRFTSGWRSSVPATAGRSSSWAAPTATRASPWASGMPGSTC